MTLLGPFIPFSMGKKKHPTKILSWNKSNSWLAFYHDQNEEQ